MSTEDTYTVRPYMSGADYERIKDWWEMKNPSIFTETTLPPLGVVVEINGSPAVALWCHLSVNIGVAFIENAVSRPRLRLHKSTKAFGVAVHALESAAKDLHYGLFVCNVSPALARILQNRLGFEPAGKADKQTLLKVL